MRLPKKIGDFVLSGPSQFCLEDKINQALFQHGKPGANMLPDGEQQELASYRFLDSDIGALKMVLAVEKKKSRRQLIIVFVEEKEGFEDKRRTSYSVYHLLKKEKPEDEISKEFRRFVEGVDETEEYQTLFSDERLRQMMGLYW